MFGNITRYLNPDRAQVEYVTSLSLFLPLSLSLSLSLPLYLIIYIYILTWNQLGISLDIYLHVVS